MAGRREVKRIVSRPMVDDSAGSKMDGGVVGGAEGVWERERRKRESMKLPVSRFVGERGR